MNIDGFLYTLWSKFSLDLLLKYQHLRKVIFSLNIHCNYNVLADDIHQCKEPLIPHPSAAHYKCYMRI